MFGTCFCNVYFGPSNKLYAMNIKVKRKHSHDILLNCPGTLLFPLVDFHKLTASLVYTFWPDANWIKVIPPPHIDASEYAYFSYGILVIYSLNHEY